MFYLKRVCRTQYPIECADVKENWIVVGCSNGEILLIYCKDRDAISRKKRICDLPIQQVVFCPDNGIVAIDAGLNIYFLRYDLREKEITVSLVFQESLKKYNFDKIPVKVFSTPKKYDNYIYIYALIKEPNKVGLIRIDPNSKYLSVITKEYSYLVDFYVLPKMSGILFTDNFVEIYDYDAFKTWLKGKYVNPRKRIRVSNEYKIVSGCVSSNMKFVICGIKTKYSSYSLFFTRKSSDIFSFDSEYSHKLDYAGKIYVFDKYSRRIAILTLDSKRILIYEFSKDRLVEILYETSDVPITNIGWISDDVLGVVTNEDVFLIDLKTKREIDKKLIQPFNELLRDLKTSIDKNDFEKMLMLLDKLSIFLPWYQLYIISKQLPEEEIQKLLTEMKIPLIKEFESLLNELLKESKKLPEYEQKTINKFLEHVKRVLKTPLSIDTLATSIPGIISLIGKIGLFAKPEFMLPVHIISYLLRCVLTKLRKKEE